MELESMVQLGSLPPLTGTMKEVQLPGG
jgi:hypothetical protein